MKTCDSRLARERDRDTKCLARPRGLTLAPASNVAHVIVPYLVRLHALHFAGVEYALRCARAAESAWTR